MNKRHGIIAAAREVCNGTHRLGDEKFLLHCAKVLSSVRAVQAVSNTPMTLKESRFVADVCDHCASWCARCGVVVHRL
jgi:hypothetical protein